MNKILVTIGIIIAYDCLAQTPEGNDILKAKQKQSGGYRTFKEFRTNSPSIKGQLDISGKFLRVLNPASNEYEKIKGDVYGACLNDTIYILFKDPKGGARFRQLDILGRFCHFIDSGKTVTLGGGSSGAFPYPYKLDCVVNINDGQMFIMDKKYMREMSKKDPDILRDFENDKLGNSKYRQYIERLNVRRIGDIKPITDLH